MIYLAILLVLCGLLILITALSVETGKAANSGNNGSEIISKPADRYTGKSHPLNVNDPSFSAEDVEIIFPGDSFDDGGEKNEEDIFISFDDEADNYNYSAREVEKTPWNTGNSGFERNQNKIDSFGDDLPGTDDMRENPDVIDDSDNVSVFADFEEKPVSAVMFDDRSNIIDYESGSGVIDTTLSKYKSIKRVGRGTVESGYDGVNFYLNEKLYRFDFHKVYDIWSGPNYIALPLKGSSTVKLFIIENSPGFPDQVEADFKEYEKGL